MSNLRVLHVIDSGGLYGAERVILTLMNEHRGMGVDPVLASIRLPMEREKDLDRAARALGLEVQPFEFSRGFNLNGAKAVVRWAENRGIDVIHSHSYRANILLSALPKKARSQPLLATLHGWSAAPFIQRIYYYEILERLLLRNADSVVAVSHAMVRTFGLVGKYSGILRVIHNPVPVHVPTERGVAAREYDRISDEFIEKFITDSFSIAAVGRLVPVKGFRRLIEALGSIVQRGVNAKLVIIGAGPLRSDLLNVADRLGLADRVALVGFHEDVTSMLPKFSVLAISSYSEGLPLVLLEAMVAGTPVVAPRVGGIPEALELPNGEELGGLFPVDADDELVAALVKVASSLEVAQARAQRASSHAMLEFSAQVVARQYLAEYLRLCPESAPG